MRYQCKTRESESESFPQHTSVRLPALYAETEVAVLFLVGGVFPGGAAP